MAGIIDDDVKPEIDALGPIVKVKCLLEMFGSAKFDKGSKAGILATIGRNLSVFDKTEDL